MKTIGRILAICILMCLAACQDHSALLNKLNEAENWMDENPELALSALKTIEPSELDREAHQARYALLAWVTRQLHHSCHRIYSST